MTRFTLTGARIFDGERIRDGDAVIVDGDSIEAVVPGASPEGAIERHDLGGGLLAPGFIDVQVNGGGGALFNNDPSLDAVRGIAAAHRRFGTTGLLPTVVTDAPEVMRRAAEAITTARREGVPGILGIHFEGPFIDPRRRGAHQEKFIRPITGDDVGYFREKNFFFAALCIIPPAITFRRISRAHFSWDANVLAVFGLPFFSYLLLRSKRAHAASPISTMP